MTTKVLHLNFISSYLLISFLLLSSFSTAQNVDQNYRTPPLDIADIVDAQPTRSIHAEEVV